MSVDEAPGARESQVHLSTLPLYQQAPFTEFGSVDSHTDLAGLNLSWREVDLPERQRTKHVHRLHPYLGKFIPQLVEIFLRKFRPNVVYDPFMGSGTTLVEANALGIAAVGCDVSAFNCLIAEVKTAAYDLDVLEDEVNDILDRLRRAGTAAAGGDNPYGREGYLGQWFAPNALSQLLNYREMISGYRYQKVLQLILSRSARSARLTTHFGLDFPSHPQIAPYFCHKHRRVCAPTQSADQFLRRYSVDTLRRLSEYARLRRSDEIRIVHGDARLLELPPIDLVVTSPPYVGLIDYHEQHRYAYELLRLERRDELEIGAACKGSAKAAREAYRREIARVLGRAAKSLRAGGAMVTIIGDRFGLYRGLAEEVGLREELQLQRHVNRRTGRRAGEFFEDILIWLKD